MSSLITATRKHMLELGRWSVVLCLFSVPINKPATSIFIFFALVFSVFGDSVKERLLSACRQPVVLGACAWFLILAISAAISIFHAPEASGQWQALGVYKALLYTLIVASLLDSPQWRDRGVLAFGLAVGLVLLISWAQFLGLVPLTGLGKESVVHRYTVFHSHTQQAIEFLVLAALAVSFSQSDANRMHKKIAWFIALAAYTNVIFISQSRTGYMIAAPLLLYWVWRLLGARHGGWRAAMLGIVVLVLVSGTAILSPRVQQRLVQAEQDLTLYSTDQEATSLGIRIELWKRSLPIIASAPLLGHGLGQWPVEFQNQVKNVPNFSGFLMGHPHQEALDILSEEGWIGLAIFIGLLCALVKYIAKLAQPQRDFYACLLLIYVTAGLVNCILIDFAERHVFLMLLACIPYGAHGRNHTNDHGESSPRTMKDTLTPGPLPPAGEGVEMSRCATFTLITP